LIKTFLPFFFVLRSTDGGGNSKPHDKIRFKALSSPIKTQFDDVDEERFRKTCAKFATGIAIVTVVDKEGQPLGITVNSFTSVSCTPPLVLVCIDYRSSILPHFRNSTYYGINVLRADQRDISIKFSQPELDRFDTTEWHAGVAGVPLLDNMLAAMECRITQTVEAGDHAIFIAEVIGADCNEGRPLLYYGSDYCCL
jgi:flavin reductase (DIM6/NTAB) family NADH-FMN oxidoreductase RutF